MQFDWGTFFDFFVGYWVGYGICYLKHVHLRRKPKLELM